MKNVLASTLFFTPALSRIKVNRRKFRSCFLPAILGASITFSLFAGNILEIQGDYLFYSFDYNYIFGKGHIKVKIKDMIISADAVQIDINDRLAQFSENCQVMLQNTTQSSDMIELNLESQQVRLTRFEETITTTILPETSPPPAFPDFVPVSFHELHQSLIYYLGKHFVIEKNYAIYGYKTTIYLEGMQSVSFRKLRLDKGIPKERDQPFRVDKIWYYPSQGFVLNTSLDFKTRGKGPVFSSSTTLQTQYDVFGKLEMDPRYRVRLNSNQKLEISKSFEINSNASFITKNMLHGDLRIIQKFGQTMNNDLTLDYSKPTFGKEETWLRFNSQLLLKKWGNTTFRYALERQNQNTLDLAYQNQLWKKLNLNFSHSFSKLLIQDDNFQRTSRSNLSISYSSKIFDLSTQYSLHRDLVQNLQQSNPNIRLSFTPFTLYQGILRFNIQSTISYTQMQNKNVTDQLFHGNTSVNMETLPYQIFPGSELSAAFQIEHYHDKNPVNRALSIGYILKGKQNLGERLTLEFNYNYNTRRELKDWFIQGTYSQDFNTTFRLKETIKSPISGWTSFAYDPKKGQFSNAYADLKLSLIKHWHFQTQVNYDFRFNKLNYDIYLYRKAGRFTFRCSYRSLSRSPMVEILAE